jgi:hypothetical protein
VSCAPPDGTPPTKHLISRTGPGHHTTALKGPCNAGDAFFLMLEAVECMGEENAKRVKGKPGNRKSIETTRQKGATHRSLALHAPMHSFRHLPMPGIHMHVGGLLGRQHTSSLWPALIMSAHATISSSNNHRLPNLCLTTTRLANHINDFKYNTIALVLGF